MSAMEASLEFDSESYTVDLAPGAGISAPDTGVACRITRVEDSFFVASDEGMHLRVDAGGVPKSAREYVRGIMAQSVDGEGVPVSNEFFICSGDVTELLPVYPIIGRVRLNGLLPKPDLGDEIVVRS